MTLFSSAPPGALGCLLLVACAHGLDPGPDEDPFSGLEGTWTERDGEGRTTTEAWIRAHPRLLLGTGTSVVGDRVRTEQLAIQLRDDAAVYVAHPEGQARTEFRRTASRAGALVFENPEHDFPRVITYRRLGVGDEARLHVRVEGAGGGRPRAFELDLARQPDGPRPADIVKTRQVEAPPSEVYAAFTTEAGVTTFFAPAARVEARPWGAYEMYFVPDAPAGSRGGEGCQLVELVPNMRLAFTWNFPPSLPTIRTAHTLVTIELEPALDAHLDTVVRLRQTGFRSGPDWEKGRAYFDRAWDFVLDNLERRFAEGPIDWGASRVSELRRFGRWAWSRDRPARP